MIGRIEFHANSKRWFTTSFRKALVYDILPESEAVECGFRAYTKPRFPAHSSKLPCLVTPLKGHLMFISVLLSTDAVSALR